MRVDAFDFDLPPALIADRPMEPREAARLLHVGGVLADARVGDLPELLAPGDILVFNDTKVIPARLLGRRGAVAVEALLHRRLDERSWLAFVKPGKRIRVGDSIDFAEDFSAEAIEKRDGGEIELRFSLAGEALMDRLRAVGHVPLPPYIRRPDDARDRTDYQTVFAREDGAVAAPTAGLHFTPSLLDRLAARGIKTARITLHVGAGTFLPVKVEDTDEHRMHAEWGRVDAAAVAAIAAAKAAGGRVVAVGTTSLRLLETAGRDGLAPFEGETDIFITPGFGFKVVDRLLTNFHLPRSTLFMLVAAFAGLPRMRAAYDHAIANGYRFYSYGDCCLIERAA